MRGKCFTWEFKSKMRTSWKFHYLLHSSLFWPLCWPVTYLFVKYSFFEKKLEDISPFNGATNTPVLDFWWHLLWVSKPEWTALFAETYMMYIPWHSPLVKHLLTSWLPPWQLSDTCEEVLVWLKSRIYSSFPLIQPSFVKLTQLAQFDKTSHAW